MGDNSGNSNGNVLVITSSQPAAAKSTVQDVAPSFGGVKENVGAVNHPDATLAIPHFFRAGRTCGSTKDLSSICLYKVIEFCPNFRIFK